jgi:hypothetical protein
MAISKKEERTPGGSARGIFSNSLISKQKMVEAGVERSGWGKHQHLTPPSLVLRKLGFSLNT